MGGGGLPKVWTCECCGCGLAVMDEITRWEMKKVVKGIIIKKGGGCQEDWTEGGGIQEQPQICSLLFLSSFPLTFLFLTFQPFQNCWAFIVDREEQWPTDWTRYRMPTLFFSYPVRTQVRVWYWALWGERGVVLLERPDVQKQEVWRRDSFVMLSRFTDLTECGGIAFHLKHTIYHRTCPNSTMKGLIFAYGVEII